jgi:hypothetical protein
LGLPPHVFGWIVVSLLAVVVVGLTAFFITTASTGTDTSTGEQELRRPGEASAPSLSASGEAAAAGSWSGS